MATTKAITPIVISEDGTQVLTKSQQKILDALTKRLQSSLQNTVENLVEIGRDLVQAKDLVGHGNFSKWLEEKFDLSDQSARRFMHVAEVFGDQVDALKKLSLRSVYLLAAPSTSEDIRKTVLQKLNKGDAVTFDEIQALRLQTGVTPAPEVETSPVNESSFRSEIRKVNKKLNSWSGQIQKDWKGLDGTINKKSKQDLETLHRELTDFTQLLGGMLEMAKEAPKKPRKNSEPKSKPVQKAKRGRLPKGKK